MLEKLDAGTFESLHGQAFQMEHEALPDGVEADLIEVHRAPETQAGLSGRAPFSLLFACAKLEEPLQAVFTLNHEAIGEIDIFLVPVGSDERGVLLEAVFN